MKTKQTNKKRKKHPCQKQGNYEHRMIKKKKKNI